MLSAAPRIPRSGHRGKLKKHRFFLDGGEEKLRFSPRLFSPGRRLFPLLLEKSRLEVAVAHSGRRPPVRTPSVPTSFTPTSPGIPIGTDRVAEADLFHTDLSLCSRQVESQMESARIGGGRLLDCPIEEFLDEDGDPMYRVLLANGSQIRYMLGDPMPLEEAQAHIRELLLMDIRYGRSDFYDIQRRRNPELLPVAAVDGAHEEVSYNHHGFCAVPASSKAIADLQETDTSVGECSVCLQPLKADGIKLRMMPCSHSFHEHCIFSWLRVGHVCPLCRFALPTK